MGDISATHSAEHIGRLQHISAFRVDELYMFMGRELEFLDEIPAGNVLGNEKDMLKGAFCYCA